MDKIKEYYTTYYDRLKDSAYLGERAKDSSRMLVFRDWLREKLPTGSRILDIGCGDMTFAKLTPEFEWHGVDIMPRDPKAITHDIESAPYPFHDKEFDAVVCSEVLEHLWNPLVVHQEARRVLKRGGKYIVSTPNLMWIANQLERGSRLAFDHTKPWVREHINQFDVDTHIKYLRMFGFNVIRFQGADAHYCPVFSPSLQYVQRMIKKKYGVEVPQGEIDQAAGIGVPHMHHTIIIESEKL